METASSSAALLIDLPPSALTGIDLLSFTVTPRFRGVKDLPPGFHFMFTGSSSALSIRHGVWFFVPPKPSIRPYLFITRWHKQSETLVTELDKAEILRWRANIAEFWREGLTPYRQSAKDVTSDAQSEFGDWPQLTSCITPALLLRITQGDENHWSLTSASSARRDRDEIPGLSAEDFDAVDEKELHLLSVDLRRTWRDGATGRERTDAAKDRSWALGELVEKQCSNKSSAEIIGELQFCFLMTLTLNNWSCFEQWKRILTVIFTCKAAVARDPDFFINSIAALRLQLQHCKDAEGGLIDLADEGGSLLKELLVRFRKGLDEIRTLDVQDVVDELDDLEALLRDEYGWRFGGTFVKSGVLELEDGEQVRMDTNVFDEDDETGEYAPQIVDLSPEQARMLNITEPSDLVATIRNTSIRDTPRHGNGGLEDESVDSEESEANHDENEDSEEETADLDEMDARF